MSKYITLGANGVIRTLSEALPLDSWKADVRARARLLVQAPSKNATGIATTCRIPAGLGVGQAADGAR